MARARAPVRSPSSASFASAREIRFWCVFFYCFAAFSRRHARRAPPRPALTSRCRPPICPATPPTPNQHTQDTTADPDVCKCADALAAPDVNGFCVCGGGSTLGVDGKCQCPTDATIVGTTCDCPDVSQLVDGACKCPSTAELAEGLCKCPGDQVLVSLRSPLAFGIGRRGNLGLFRPPARLPRSLTLAPAASTSPAPPPRLALHTHHTERLRMRRPAPKALPRRHVEHHRRRALLPLPQLFVNRRPDRPDVLSVRPQLLQQHRRGDGAGVHGVPAGRCQQCRKHGMRLREPHGNVVAGEPPGSLFFFSRLSLAPFLFFLRAPAFLSSLTLSLSLRSHLLPPSRPPFHTTNTAY
jgi:hypothetical protein